MKNLGSLTYLNLSNFNTINVKDMEGMFFFNFIKFKLNLIKK